MHIHGIRCVAVGYVVDTIYIIITLVDAAVICTVISVII